MTYSSRSKSAFTLVELLMVMMVITILYCISLSVIRAVSRSAYKTAARAELKSIETAVKQYYAHYLVWPYMPDGQDPERGQNADPTIDATLAGILTGTYEGGSGDLEHNPDHIVFIEFSRQDATGVPYNPWGASGRYEKEKCLYHIDVDSDLDNYVQPTLPSEVSRPQIVGIPSDGRLCGSVAVWTLNPEVAKPDPGIVTGNAYDDAVREYLLGNWQ
jgi:prepilin-type N-terminal cleavage/methylation domain-containing protein